MLCAMLALLCCGCTNYGRVLWGNGVKYWELYDNSETKDYFIDKKNMTIVNFNDVLGKPVAEIKSIVPFTLKRNMIILDSAVFNGGLIKNDTIWILKASKNSMTVIGNNDINTMTLETDFFTSPLDSIAVKVILEKVLKKMRNILPDNHLYVKRYWMEVIDDSFLESLNMYPIDDIDTLLGKDVNCLNVSLPNMYKGKYQCICSYGKVYKNHITTYRFSKVYIFTIEDHTYKVLSCKQYTFYNGFKEK